MVRTWVSLALQHSGGGGPVRQFVSLGGPPDGLRVTVFRQGLLGMLAPETAMADPAESGADGNPYVVVDEDGAGPDLPAHPQRAVTVLGEHRRNQSERGAVGDPYRLAFVGERDQGDHRTEDLFPGYPHARSHVGQHGR